MDKTANLTDFLSRPWRDFHESGPGHPDLEVELSKAVGYLDDYDREMVTYAYRIAEYYHASHKPRKSGLDYIYHPVAVTIGLAAHKVDVTCLVAALLHDVIEDHGDKVGLEDIRRWFGEEKAVIIEGVTHVDALDAKVQKEKMAIRMAESGAGVRTGQDVVALEKSIRKGATERKIVNYVAKDPRTLIVKAYDRIDNLKSLHAHGKPEKEKQIAIQSVEFYAALAASLGMYVVKTEIEELAFPYIDPQAYNDLSIKVDELCKEREERWNQVAAEVRNLLYNEGIVCNVQVVKKQLYSMYREMQKGKQIDELLPELVTMRVQVATEMHCHGAFGLIRNYYRPVGDWYDYISQPKRNQYRAYRGKVLVWWDLQVEGLTVEFEICTYAQSITNEYGLMASCMINMKSARTGEQKTVAERQKFQRWLQALNAVGSNHELNGDYPAALRDFMDNNIVVFTPENESYTLPTHGSVLDFAYALGVEFGNHAVGALVNGVRASLLSELKDSDVVQVLLDADKEVQVQQNWCDACRTGTAYKAVTERFAKQLAVGSFEDQSQERVNALATHSVAMVTLAIKAQDRFGITGDLIEVVNGAQVDLRTCWSKSIGRVAYIDLEVSVETAKLNQINNLVKALRGVSGVTSVVRH